MVATTVRNLFKYLSNLRLHPHAKIAYGARVAEDCYLGQQVRIGRDAYIWRSKLGNNVHLQEGTRVFNSTLGDNVVIYPRCVLNDVQAGSYSFIAENSNLSRTRLGRFCSVGPYFLCGYGDHPVDFVSTSPVFYSTRRQCGISLTDADCFQEQTDIDIGSDVWIGARVFIRDGVKIGHGAILAAGAVVVKDVPDYAIVVGVPARVLRLRFAEDVIRELLALEWWNWSEERLREAQKLFAGPDVMSFVQQHRQGSAQQARNGG